MSFRFVEPRTRVGDGIENFAGAKLFFFDFGTSTAKTTFSDFALTSANTDPVVADSDGLFPDIFLDIKATVTLETSTGVNIYGPEDIFAPEDGITALLAALVSVLDSAGNFTATDVELILKEISDDWAKLARTNTFLAIQTHTAAVQMSDQELRRALLRDYAIKHNSVSSAAGVLTLNLTTGNSFVTTLTENVTTVTISDPPASGNYGQFVIKIIQDGAGGAFTVTWPSSVIWPGGTAPRNIDSIHSSIWRSSPSCSIASIRRSSATSTMRSRLKSSSRVGAAEMCSRFPWERWLAASKSRIDSISSPKNSRRMGWRH